MIAKGIAFEKAHSLQSNRIPQMKKCGDSEEVQHSSAEFSTVIYHNILLRLGLSVCSLNVFPVNCTGNYAHSPETCPLGSFEILN